MEKLKRKLNLIIVAGVCIFASMFGIGVNALAVQNASYSTVVMSDEEEASSSSVNTTEDVTGNVKISIANEYFVDGVSQIGNTDLSDLTFNSSTTVTFTNTLVEFSDATGFANFNGATVSISNSIFVYTGSATSGIALLTPPHYRGQLS